MVSVAQQRLTRKAAKAGAGCGAEPCATL